MNPVEPVKAGVIQTDNELDRKLIEGLRRNDRTALAAAYDAYSDTAYALAARLLGPGPIAAEVVRDAFLELWRQAAGLDVGKGLQSPLLSIVHRRAVEHLHLLPPDQRLAGNQDQEAASATGSHRVRSAFEGLPQEQRQVLDLTYFSGLTISEAAAVMEMPVQSALVHLKLGLGNLSRRLEDDA